VELSLSLTLQLNEVTSRRISYLANDNFKNKKLYKIIRTRCFIEYLAEDNLIIERIALQLGNHPGMNKWQ